MIVGNGEKGKGETFLHGNQGIPIRERGR